MRPLLLILSLALTGQALTHDIWIETDKAVYQSNQSVNLSLMLGNHGNHHRDYKLASYVKPGQATFDVYPNQTASVDYIKNLRLTSVGNDKFWQFNANFQRAGQYAAASTFDQVMTYAPVRDIKSAKAYFWIEPSSSTVKTLDYKIPLGHKFELIPQSDPSRQLRAGRSFSVKVLFNGNPKPGIVVSFIPKGIELVDNFDPFYQRVTDENGEASYPIGNTGPHLVAAHLKDPRAKGIGYQGINYSATLFLNVPPNP